MATPIKRRGPGAVATTANPGLTSSGDPKALPKARLVDNESSCDVNAQEAQRPRGTDSSASPGLTSSGTLASNPEGKTSRQRVPRDVKKAKGVAGFGWRPLRAVSYSFSMTSRMRRAVSDGVLPTLTPTASRASCFACAVPAEPDTIAPAWPIVLPSGAVKPAT